jgi:four helix bundle protein
MKEGNSFAENFEDLRVWQEARVQAVEIYQRFGLGTPSERDFGFRDQIQRAAVSVMENIREGFEKKTPKHFARFLDNAKGSCGEVRSMLYLGEDLSDIAAEETNNLRVSARGLSRGIEALARSLRSRVD